VRIAYAGSRGRESVCVRERERDRERAKHTHTHAHACVHGCVYVHNRTLLTDGPYWGCGAQQPIVVRDYGYGPVAGTSPLHTDRVGEGDACTHTLTHSLIIHPFRECECA
jgi:hypothetical protein